MLIAGACDGCWHNDQVEQRRRMRLAVLFTLKAFQTTAVWGRKWSQIMHNHPYLGRAEVLHLATAKGDSLRIFLLPSAH